MVMSHQQLDELRLALSQSVVQTHTADEIRAKILSNLGRWKQQGCWGSAYGEWEEIARNRDDGALFTAMLARDENAVRLRQSMPYVGMLPREEVKRLWQEAARSVCSPADSGKLTGSKPSG